MSWTTLRNRHNREEHHFGELPAALVELSSALGNDLPAGATLEEAILTIHLRLLRLDDADVRVSGFKALAEIMPMRFWADAFIQPYFWSDAVMLAPQEAWATADAIARREYGGSASADAVTLAMISGGVAAQSRFWDNGMVDTVDADAAFLRPQEGQFTADAARMEPGSGSFLADARFGGIIPMSAVIMKTQTSLSGPIGYTHQSHTAYTPQSWTHVPQANAKAIVVIVANNNDAPSGVYYGGKALTYRKNGSIYGRTHWYYSLEDLSGRTNDTVVVYGISTGKRTFYSSTILDCATNISYVTSAGPSSWAAWTTGNYTFTLNDTVPGNAYRAQFNATSGEGSATIYDIYYAQGVRAYQGDGTGYYLSGSSTQTDNAVAVVLNLQGPDTSSTIGGFTLTGASGARFHTAILFQAATIEGITADAVIS